VILSLDTSSLVKLYLDEEHSPLVHEWVADAEVVATCRIAYPEALSAFTRRFKARELTGSQYETLVGRFTEDWPAFVTLDFDELEAGRLARQHGLRGFDAVHLASALLLRQTDPAPEVTFSSFDERQCAAAQAEGLAVLTG
jgi:predicted nucleic acid-binding protein